MGWCVCDNVNDLFGGLCTIRKFPYSILPIVSPTASLSPFVSPTLFSTHTQKKQQPNFRVLFLWYKSFIVGSM